MKPLKVVFALPLLYILAFSTTTTFVSCKKTVTLYDTTIRTIHDTTIKNIHDTTIKNIHDTVIINDTVYDLGSGLIAYYNFNGGSLKDSSGFNNDIVFNSATLAADRFGNANNAYSFDGSSSYMRVTNNVTLNPNAITMFAIVKVNGFYTGTCHANVIVMKGNQDPINGFYTLRFVDERGCTEAPDIANEKFGAGFGDNSPGGAGAGVTSGSYLVETSKWVHIAAAYDGISFKFYVDGQLQETTTKTVGFTPNGYDLFIGKTENPTYPYYFNGVIDELRLYNRALSANEIGALNKK